ncbi:MAG: DUF3343 domain-containing protein [Lachnospiraceae bacterium]|nr:DUF3343 domain-containing protein [Lachnospiraceae bacterium]
MICIATFFSHFGAIRFRRFCTGKGWSSQIMPVPRDLSSSCGTCVRYEDTLKETISEGGAGAPLSEEYEAFCRSMEELEQVVACTDAGYQVLYRAENI